MGSPGLFPSLHVPPLFSDKVLEVFWEEDPIRRDLVEVMVARSAQRETILFLSQMLQGSETQAN